MLSIKCVPYVVDNSIGKLFEIIGINIQFLGVDYITFEL